MCAKKYRDLTGAKIVISEQEREFTQNNDLNLYNKYFKNNNNFIIENFNFDSDILVNNNYELNFCDYKIKIMSTPGHTIGSVCYILENNIFSGDTLFAGTCGRTRFPTGNKQDMKNSLTKLYNLKNNYIIYPGHENTTDLYTEKLNKTGL